MKVLILSVTAGEGHNSTGKAIIEGMRREGIECEMLDTYKYISPLLGETISKGYLITSQKTPGTYRLGYHLAEQKEKNTDKYSLSNLMNAILSHGLEEYIYEYAPDYIICTHVFAAQIINRMKLSSKHKLSGVKTLGIVTDFCIHPFWPDVEKIDHIVTASELIEGEAVRKGIERERLLPFGIPVNPKFEKKGEKREAREKLGLSQELFTVLVMSGSMGYGNIAEVVEEVLALPMPVQVISVCGNNKKAKAQIDKLERENLHNFGFVTNVDEMMDAADCIITKPGGITTSEALSKGLPIIIMHPIPGQEDRNTEFLLNSGVAMKASKTAPIGDVLFQLLRFPERVESLRDNVRRVGKPHAVRDLCRFVKSELEGQL